MNVSYFSIKQLLFIVLIQSSGYKYRRILSSIMGVDYCGHNVKIKLFYSIWVYVRCVQLSIALAFSVSWNYMKFRVVLNIYFVQKYIELRLYSNEPSSTDKNRIISTLHGAKELNNSRNIGID